ncbi:hypothetical protein ACIBBG_31960 [Micromonospora chersina]|uniref:hypothetical protein n=1 Tax=Micromonospora chersina TaxID=47854 RepID=UPI00379A308F
MSWYARIETTEAGIHLHPLPDSITPEDLDQLLTELRGRYGIPDDWAEHPDRGAPVTRLPGGQLTEPAGRGWGVAILSGPLHPSLLAIATVHDDEAA